MRKNNLKTASDKLPAETGNEHADNFKIPSSEVTPVYRMFKGIPVNVSVGSEDVECHCIGGSICRSPIKDLKL